MAVDPLFVPSIAILKARLRLTGAAQPNALAQIDDAIEQVRVGFYTRLGSSVISEINATAYLENGTTPAQLRKTKAILAEILWVRAILLGVLPMLFMDTSAVDRQAWNEEGLTRNLGASEIDRQIKALMQSVEEYLSELSGESEDASEINVSTIGPLTPPPRPGDSILGGSRFGASFED